MRRFGMALVLALSLVALAAPAGFAAKPYQGSFDDTYGPFDVTGVCAFTFQQTAHNVGTWHAWLDSNGIEVKEQDFVTEQDTFSGPNGTPFMSDPYRYTYHKAWDSSGTPTEWVVTGTILRVTLPDGTVFRSTGRANVLPTGGFAMTVDSGHSGNLDAFCAALK